MIDKLNRHIKIIRFLLLLIALLGLIGSVFITLFIMTISCDSQSRITMQCIIIGGTIGLMILAIYSIFPLIIQIGLKKPTPRIFKLAKIFSILIMLYFPVGTALAVYFLKILWKLEKQDAFPEVTI